MIKKDVSASFDIFQDRLDREMHQAAQSFVCIGYLLKIARDTNILAGSGYKDVNEYAKARYGLSRDLVSRYMAINDRFSEGGYSETLVEKYRSTGMTKLAEMLTLSDEVIAAIPSGTTREEIRRIKAEIAEEEKVTDIEVALEPPLPEAPLFPAERTLLQEVLYLYFLEIPERYPLAHTEVNQPDEDGLLEVFAPTGQAVKIVRIPGRGKLMMSFDGQEPVGLVNVRTNESYTYPWEKFAEELKALCPATLPPKRAWTKLYGQPFPESEAKKSGPEQKPARPEQKTPKPEQKPAKPDQKPEKPKTDKGKPETAGPEEIKPQKKIEAAEEDKTAEAAEVAEEAEEEGKAEEEAEAAEDTARYYSREIERNCRELVRKIHNGEYKEARKTAKKISKMINVLISAQESNDIPGQITMEGMDE